MAARYLFAMGHFHIGCAVWGFEGWVGELYPSGARSSDYLRLYAERFTAVEGNTTFYGVPSTDSLSRWKRDTPAGFRFLPKLHRDYSHGANLVSAIEGSLGFLEHMSRLGERLGPIHIQLPPSFAPDRAPELEAFLRQWPRDRFPAAVELRHAAWFEGEVKRRSFALFEELGIHRAVLETRPIFSGSDDPQAQSRNRKPELPVIPRATGGAAFIRFISHPLPERNEAELAQWADEVAKLLANDTDVYFFAHCPDERHSPAIARRFQALLEERGAEIPPLPWNELGPPPEQLGLF